MARLRLDARRATGREARASPRRAWPCPIVVCELRSAFTPARVSPDARYASPEGSRKIGMGRSSEPTTSRACSGVPMPAMANRTASAVNDEASRRGPPVVWQAHVLVVGSPYVEVGCSQGG